MRQIKNFDVSGYVTKYNILCADGRTIAQEAFKECDGKVVPLTYNFNHSSPDFVLGSVILEHRLDGVYGYCKFNECPTGVLFKRLVKDFVFNDFGIYANKLKEKDGIVTYGVIREVSLVLSGANPGAYIDYYTNEVKENESDVHL